MKFFAKKRGRAGVQNNGRDKAAGMIADAITGLQSKWAMWMHRHCERLSRRGKMVVLILCCLFTGAYCAFVITRGLTGKSQISMPKAGFRPPVMLDDSYTSVPDSQALLSLRAIRQTLDSLSNKAAGRKIYDSLIKTRPGVLDSLQYIEKIYQLKSKN